MKRNLPLYLRMVHFKKTYFFLLLQIKLVYMDEIKLRQIYKHKFLLHLQPLKPKLGKWIYMLK